MELNKLEGFYELDSAEMYDIEGGADPNSVAKAFKLACKFGKVGIVVFVGAAAVGVVYELLVGE